MGEAGVLGRAQHTTPKLFVFYILTSKSFALRILRGISRQVDDFRDSGGGGGGYQVSIELGRSGHVARIYFAQKINGLARSRVSAQPVLEFAPEEAC
jgi:hypothetical protein